MSREEKEDRESVLASAVSEAEPVQLDDIFDFSDSFFDQDPVPTPVEECSTLPEGSVVEIPLPCLNDCDSDSLVREQQADVSLKPLFLLAQKNEKGYAIENQILVQSTSDELGDFVQRICVPIGGGRVF